MVRPPEEAALRCAPRFTTKRLVAPRQIVRYNGNCIDLSVFTGQNLCPSSASAPAPSTAITCADSPCQNGGTCTDVNGEFSCNCNYNGWQGPTCENDYKECTYQHRNNCPVEIVQQNGVDVACSSLSDCRAIDNSYQCYNNVCKKYSYACTELIGTYQCSCGEGFQRRWIHLR